MTQASAHNATVIDQHNRQAGEYARLTASLASDRPTSFRELMAPAPGDRVLDIACGPGLLSTGLAPHVAEVVGLDLTPGMLSEAGKRQASLGIENIIWVEGDAAALPFADASFTLIVCSAAFHHFERPAQVMKEMARVCRAGGRIAVTDVTQTPEKAAAYDRIELMRDPSHRHAHSVEEFLELGRGAGLGEAIVRPGQSGEIPFDAVLATSHPRDHSKDEIRALLEEDARSGKNKLGFQAHFTDGRLMAAYSTSAFRWDRP